MSEEYRIEKDSLGAIEVPAEHLWGAQTERSRRNFRIGGGKEPMPEEIVRALARIKKAAALANRELQPGKMTPEKCDRIGAACDAVLAGELEGEFPLIVWQTGSGTQTNMNVNEVIAHYGNRAAGRNLLHPNDDVNMAQSSNDVFPSALHLAAVGLLRERVLPALSGLTEAFRRLEEENRDAVKCGRTHLQDALPMSFAQEISGWRSSLERDEEYISLALNPLYELALGGTAIGTGLNAPAGFDGLVCRILAEDTGCPYRPAENKFHALSSKSELLSAHAALKALAADLMKIANDVRWLASGPRLGLGEISIPANEPGSSIMPGKVNPTQCEAVTMVAAEVLGADVTLGIAASQGNFELNVYMPLIGYRFCRSANLLADVMESFAENCVKGIKADREKMRSNLHNSLMLATALSPRIGYERAAKTVQKAYGEGISLKAACVALGFLSPEEFDAVFHPEEMI